MYSQLGNMVFDKANGFTSLSDTLEITYAEHNLINQVTVLQPTGRNPQEYNINIFFHQRFCNVAEQIKALDDAATSYQILPLLMGNGKLLGNFVIISREKSIIESTPQGDIVAVNISLVLKEHISDVLTTEQQQDKQNAFAVDKKSNSGTSNSNKKPKSKSPIQPSCANKLSENRKWILAHAAREQSNYSLYQKSNDDGIAERIVRAAKKHVQETSDLCNKLSSISDCLSKYKVSNSLIINTKTACSNLYAAYSSPLLLSPGTKALIANSHNIYQAKVTDLCKALQAADKDLITRK